MTQLEKDAQWVLNYLCSAEAMGAHAPVETMQRVRDAIPQFLAVLDDAREVISKAFEFDDGDVFGVMHNAATDTLSSIEVLLEQP